MEIISRESLLEQASKMVKARIRKKESLFIILFSILSPVAFAIVFQDFTVRHLESYLNNVVKDHSPLLLFLPIAAYIIFSYLLAWLIFNRKPKAEEIEEKLKELMGDRESELKLEISMLQKDIRYRETELTKRQVLLTQLNLIKEDQSA